MYVNIESKGRYSVVGAIWYLRQFNLFKELSEIELKSFEKITVMSQVPKGGNAFSPGDPSNSVYLLKTGAVQIIRKSEDGKEISLALISPGEFFGELALADETTRDCFARALQDSLVCRTGKETFANFLRTHPEFGIRVTKLIGIRLKTIESRLADLAFRSVASRLARVLLDVAEKFGMKTPEGTAFKIRLTHKDLASLAATTRETASVLLAEWKKRGILDPDTRRIVIQDFTILQQIASGTIAANLPDQQTIR